MPTFASRARGVPGPPTRGSRRSLLLASLWLCLSAAPSLQQAPQAPVFRGGVDLVALDVTVVDADGRPVKGLTADDFAVKIQGQLRPVRTLDFMDFGSSAASEATPANAVSSNQSPEAKRASRGGRVIVLLFDDLSTKPGEATELRVAAERILGTLGPDDLVGLTTTSGLGPVVSPTRDRAAVVAVLQSKLLVGRDDDLTDPFYISVKEATDFVTGLRGTSDFIQRECEEAGMSAAKSGCREKVAAVARQLARETIDRAGMELAAYTGTIDALRSAPKPRVVIALSTGVALGTAHNVGELDPVSQAAAAADVQFYALVQFVEGTDVRDRTYLRRSVRRAENDYLIDGIKSVASAAGGEAFTVVGQADRFFTRIFSETSGVYRLGVEMPALTKVPQFLDVKVAVDRPHVTIRAQRHALAPGVANAPVSPASIETSLRARVGQGGVAFGVPMVLATALRRDASDDRLQLGVEAEIPATVMAPLTVMFAVVDASGHIVESGQRQIGAGATGQDYQIAIGVPVAEGTYRLRFAVADAEGHIGSLERAVVGHLARFGALRVSDLLTTWATAAGPARLLALDVLPATAARLGVTLELYPDAGRVLTGVRVRFTLLRSDGDTPATIAEHDVAPIANGTVFTCSATLPATALEPAAYTIQASVIDAGAVTGVVSTEFRKAR